jgi:mannose-1-phosphate guanylyltransferase
MNKPHKALILAGGLGTRLRPITDEVPKCLVEILDKPILEYWIDALVDIGVKDILVNTHHHREKVVEYFSEIEKKKGITITESFEPELLGSGGTIAANPHWVTGDEKCIIIYVDNLSNVNLSEICQFHDSHSLGFTMMLFNTNRPKECGIAELSEDSVVVSFEEKPASPKSNLANAGLYVVDSKQYREIADSAVFDFGFDVLPQYVGKMAGWVFDGYHKDIGNLDALRQIRDEAHGIFS